MTLWTVACKTPLSIGFSRQEYWSGLPFPPPGDLPDPRIKPKSLTSPASAGGFFTTSTTWEAHSLLQAIFLNQGSNSGLLHCRFFTVRATREKAKPAAPISPLDALLLDLLTASLGQSLELGHTWSLLFFPLNTSAKTPTDGGWLPFYGKFWISSLYHSHLVSLCLFPQEREKEKDHRISLSRAA